MNNQTYIENRITDLLSEMGSSFSDLQQRFEMDSYIGNEDTSYEEIEIRDMIKSYFIDNAKSVYKLICNYIEQLKHTEYLSDFKSTMKSYFDEPTTILKGEMNDYDGQVYSKLIQDISDFLNAYEFYGERGYEYLMKRAGILYLENILENTAVIINDLGKKPNSETNVYKSVKVVCRAAFPTAVYPTSPFISIAKEYKPDILITYLNCAIEYKYATDENRLKEIIDQILIDVHGYSNHPTYKIFYAVFYVKPDIWGRKKFEEVWKEKKFPQNWKGIYVVG